MSTRDSEPVYMALPASRLPLSAGEPAVAPPRATAKETPLAVEVNGEPYAVMMVTPSDIEDFAVGFALAERLIAQASDVARIDIREARIRGNRGALAVDIRLDRSAEARVAERRRMLPGNAGCGICGVMTLEEALPELPAFEIAPSFPREAISRALDALAARQDLNNETGAAHGAAFCNARGEILALREDVGRHNAFDKIVGHIARERHTPGDGFALLTSRCSYELVQKAVLARIPMLVTISAPTELAVSMAREARLTLVALARPDGALVFHDPFGAFV